MAILIEEDKKQVSMGRVFGWTIFFIACAVAAYYIFFANPTLVSVTPPSGFENVQTAAHYGNFDVGSVLNNIVLSSLNQSSSITLPSGNAPQSPRHNPFMAP